MIWLHRQSERNQTRGISKTPVLPVCGETMASALPQQPTASKAKGWLRTLWQMLVRSHQRRQSLKVLRSLSPAQLRDIGLTKEDLR